MNLDPKKFEVINEPFTCSHCGRQVKILKGSCRDHCPHCLWGLHVDCFPGDRQNSCRGQLRPVKIETDNRKGRIIIFSCEKCKQQVRCKAAPDDSLEVIEEIMRATLPPLI